MGHRSQKDLISVLMCVYNTPVEYLDEAVKSVLNQTYSRIEFVIVDDCSDDKEVCKYLAGIKDHRVQIYRNKDNLGLTKSLNVGINLCKGAFIARIDSDDILRRNRIEEQYNYAEKNDNAIIGCNWKQFPKYENHPIYQYNHEGYKVAMSFGNAGPCHSTFFINKKRIDEKHLRYDEQYRTAQDYALLCDCLTAGEKIGMCPKTLIGWRKHDAQISAAKKDQQDDDANRIRRSYLLRNFKISESMARKFINNIHEHTYETAEDGRHAEKVLNYFIKNNNRAIVDKEVHKYWFRQSIKRYKEVHKIDFVKTRMFRECLRADRFIYIMYNFFIERASYLFQLFVRI